MHIAKLDHGQKNLKKLVENFMDEMELRNELVISLLGVPQAEIEKLFPPKRRSRKKSGKTEQFCPRLVPSNVSSGGAQSPGVGVVSSGLVKLRHSSMDRGSV